MKNRKSRKIQNSRKTIYWQHRHAYLKVLKRVDSFEERINRADKILKRADRLCGGQLFNATGA